MSSKKFWGSSSPPARVPRQSRSGRHRVLRPRRPRPRPQPLQVSKSEFNITLRGFLNLTHLNLLGAHITHILSVDNFQVIYKFFSLFQDGRQTRLRVPFLRNVRQFLLQLASRAQLLFLPASRDPPAHRVAASRGSPALRVPRAHRVQPDQRPEVPHHHLLPRICGDFGRTSTITLESKSL